MVDMRGIFLLLVCVVVCAGDMLCKPRKQMVYGVKQGGKKAQWLPINICSGGMYSYLLLPLSFPEGFEPTPRK